MANVAIKTLGLKWNPDRTILREVDKWCYPKTPKGIRGFNQEMRAKIGTTLMRNCHMCPLYLSCISPVAPKPIFKPKMWSIGRNPGKGDDVNSTLFSTEASGGKLYQRYLRVLGLHESEVYTTNVCMCRTKQNSPPQPYQLSMCSGWKRVELSYIQRSRYFLAMGNDALRLFFGLNYPAVQRIYGDLYLIEWPDHYESLIIPVQHPGFILRHPEETENTMVLLQQVAEIIKDPEGFNLPWDKEGNSFDS